MRVLAPLFFVVLAAAPALADGSYSGASSVAGGHGAACAGVTPMNAYVSGSSIELTGYAYEGSGDRATGSVKSDGAFTATMASPKGDVTFSGRVTSRSVQAQWKGPDCWGAVDLNK
ncbi:MAG: hypothetical protein LWW93_01365 [Hyphomicrobiales bacterium]|nr:hypothetical protein [Hyphomicrobiales bacterium]